MKKWYYFCRPCNMACHNLTSTHSPPPTFRTLLGLGLSFCPIPHSPICGMKDSLARFKRDLYLKIYFAGQELPPSKLFVRSDWQPPSDTIPTKLRVRMRQFQARILRLFHKKTRCPPNLVPHQNSVLHTLKESPDLLVVRNGQKPWSCHCGPYNIRPQGLHGPPVRHGYLSEPVSH
jgi:hypothetical protein